jgi:FkbM family methyltransferase
VVLDLGCNMGNFTLMALGHGPNVRVVAVEPSGPLCEKWRQSVRANGWESRAQLVQGFIGGQTWAQEDMEKMPECRGAEFISEDELIERFGLTRVDFMKVDIEGSEYDLLKPGGRLLGLARQIAVEVHSWGGDMDEFESRLHTCGFEVMATVRHPVADILLARRPG